MRHYFFDASALVKLHTIEPGSRRVKDMVRSAVVHPPASRVFICDLAHPEAASALNQMVSGPDAARYGLGRLSLRKLPADLADHFGAESVFLVTRSSEIVAEAAELVWKHRIKGADAIHLASAVVARKGVSVGGEFYFVGSDRRQNQAAAAEGFDVIDPTA